ncbi:MAG TPA: LLM class flavin-dependent oxidoreductase [Verrucomicrobiae bacterium]|nr:LLM class flavin-dependent oxidoreductase [Verrucomicrobiae bacterium]
MADEKKFSGEIGVHYPLHVLNRYSVPELIALAERAREALAPFGFAQIWTNDNLEYRNVVAASAALVARVPVKLGTAITVPYFRNPVDLAMSFATISELTPGREVSLGLGPGSRSILTHQVDRVKPLGIMDELAGALRTLFNGDTLRRETIPILSSYFHLNAETYALRFKPQAPIRLYYGPSLLKPAVLDLISRRFDGVVLQTLYGASDMEDSLARMEKARAGSPLGEPLRKVMLLNASIARDGAAAKQHAKRFVSHIVSGWPDDVLQSKGIDPAAIGAVRRAYAENRGVDYAAGLTPDQAVERLIIAGTPAECRERIATLFSLAARHGFQQIALGVPLGPDVDEAIELWGKEILPGLG